MGIYNTYGDVQLKVGDLQMIEYKIGDKTDIPDGVYVAPEGVVVVVGGRFAARFNDVISKWGDAIPTSDIIDAINPVKRAIRLVERRLRPRNRASRKTART